MGSIKLLKRSKIFLKVVGFGDSSGLLGARHRLLSGRCLGASGAIIGSGQPVTVRAERGVEGTVSGEKPLGVAGGLGAAPLSFALASRLRGAFSPLVQPLVRAVLDPGEQRLGGSGGVTN